MNGTRYRSAAPLVAGVLLLAACGGSLEADDPTGYEACQVLAEADEITDDPALRMGMVLEAGEQASRAETPEIRESAERIGDQWIADSEALADACEANL